jgi:hypothetical protein
MKKNIIFLKVLIVFDIPANQMLTITNFHKRHTVTFFRGSIKNVKYILRCKIF